MKLEDFNIDFNRWPSSWKGIEEDIAPGKRMMEEVFLPYFQFLVESGLTKKTIRKHINNSWVLGGEIIRGIYFEEDEFRDLSGLELVLRNIEGGEGPLLYHSESEAEQSAFDSSCKKLLKFLTKNNVEIV